MSSRCAALVLWGIASMTALSAHAADASRSAFGQLADGTRIDQVTLTNDHGVSAAVMTLGAALQSLVAPDRDGKPDDIVLGYDTPAEYLADPQYFGASVGRFANRIAKGRFSLDGKTYQLETNDGPNTLHGGLKGFDKRVWTISEVKSGPVPSVTMTYHSADGEGGYPGAVVVSATYTLDNDDALTIRYQASTDKPTIVNISNHSYWALAGQHAPAGVMGELLTIDATAFTPIDETLIPTGEIRPVAGTPFDFRTPMTIGARVRDSRDDQIRFGRGYDHNFVIDGAAGTMRRAARLEDRTTGRVLEVWSKAPGLQFYSGNFLDAKTRGKGGRLYREGDAVVFEPQLFPDAPNHPDFASARLEPGQTYSNTIVFRFSTESN
ncbi:galactose mutarotase [Sphingomonas koreensis]|nr:galactose mutarotase [Sphingomonas koreensis]